MSDTLVAVHLIFWDRAFCEPRAHWYRAVASELQKTLLFPLPSTVITHILPKSSEWFLSLSYFFPCFFFFYFDSGWPRAWHMLGKHCIFNLYLHPSCFLVYTWVLFQSVMECCDERGWRKLGRACVTTLSFWASIKVAISETAGPVAKDSAFSLLHCDSLIQVMSSCCYYNFCHVLL